MTEVAREVTERLFIYEYEQIVKDDLVNLICAYGFSNKFQAHINYLAQIVGMEEATTVLNQVIADTWRKV